VPHALTDLMLSRSRVHGWPQPSTIRGRNATIHCLSGSEDLTPARLMATGGTLEQVLYVNQPAVLKKTFGKWRPLARTLGCERIGGGGNVVCCRRDGDDLLCRSERTTRGDARANGFYARSHIAYHLFDSFQKTALLGEHQIEWSNLTVAPLYRRALGLSQE